MKQRNPAARARADRKHHQRVIQDKRRYNPKWDIPLVLEEDGCTCDAGGSAGCPVHDEAVKDHNWDDETGDHSTYGTLDWRQEVANGDTKLGYVEWVNHQIEAEGEHHDEEG
jgi:hypothetical protein